MIKYYVDQTGVPYMLEESEAPEDFIEITQAEYEAKFN